MSDLLAQLAQRRLLAIIRADDPDLAVRCARLLVEAGVAAVEVSSTTPGGIEAIVQLYDVLPDSVLLGPGTVLTAADAEAAFAEHLERQLAA